MGAFNAISNLVQGFSGGQGGGDHAAVAGGLLQELGGAGGLAGLIQSFQQNGAGGLVQQFANGQTGAMDTNSLEQAVAGTGLIDSVAQRTGLPADSVKSSLATIVPLLIHHVTSNGHITTDGQQTGASLPESGSLLQSVLGKLL
jgi:uncharacterized protein YidB (DUF937 family)